MQKSQIKNRKRTRAQESSHAIERMYLTMTDDRQVPQILTQITRYMFQKSRVLLLLLLLLLLRKQKTVAGS